MHLIVPQCRSNPTNTLGSKITSRSHNHNYTVSIDHRFVSLLSLELPEKRQENEQQVTTLDRQTEFRPPLVDPFHKVPSN